jgi:UDP-N-acetyl-D-mannosaminuronate dehydrogenase
VNDFKARLLRHKTVSVWGTGYLGYTTTLQFQAKGFRVRLFDFGSRDFADNIARGNYPTPEQRKIWSRSICAPLPDTAGLTVASRPEDILDTPLHVISMPRFWEDGTDIYASLAATLGRAGDKIGDSLVLFLAAETPGTIERAFIGPLLAKGAACAFACALRSDWSLEEFFASARPRPIAGHDARGLAMAESLFESLGVQTFSLAGIREAEVYENARNSLNYTVSAFVNQLALAYPDVNVRQIGDLLAGSLASLPPTEAAPSLGSIGYKTTHSVDHLLDGAKNDQYLSIIREAQSTNISVILHYADLIVGAGIRSATILGLACPGSLRDIRLSPSIVLAEYLHSQGVEVHAHDPNFTIAELAEILPFARPARLTGERVAGEAVILMNDKDEYRALSQEDIDASGIGSARVVIDNPGIFREYAFSPGTAYHVPGDGNLKMLG